MAQRSILPQLGAHAYSGNAVCCAKEQIDSEAQTVLRALVFARRISTSALPESTPTR